jgi:ABC-type antimicrobial peptide transport system permease subunit
MLYHYLKIAFRNLLNHKVQNLIGIVGLAVGFVVFSICCYIIQFWLSQDAHYPGSERMYRVQVEHHSTVIGGISRLENFAGVEKMTSKKAFSTNSEMTLNNKGENLLVKAGFHEVDTSFLSFFSMKLTAGNMKTVLNTPNSMVLFESFARKWSDSPEAFVGTTALLGETSYQITGILKDLPKNTTVFYAADLPSGIIVNKIDGAYSKQITKWNSGYGYSITLMLHKGVTQEKMQHAFDASGFVFEGNNVKDRVLLESLRVKPFESDMLVSMVAIFVTGLLVLLIALFNYISFQTAKFYNRLGECAVRQVNGAGKIQQLWLFYTEVAMVLICACFVGFMLLDILAQVLEGQPEIARKLDLSIEVLRLQLVKYTAIGLVVAFLLCIIPVSIINRLSIRTVLMGLTSKGKRSGFRNALMFVQMVILLLFMSLSMIVSLQMETVKESIFTCFPKEEQQRTVISYVYDKNLMDNCDVLAAHVKASPYVEDLAVANYPATTYGSLNTVNMGLPGHEKERVRMYPVSSNFFDFFHARLLKGALFNDESPFEEVVVNATCAALYPNGDPVGASIGKQRIVGVIEDIQHIKEINDHFMYRMHPVIYSRNSSKETTWYTKAVPGKQKEAKQHLLSCVREFLPKTIDYNTKLFTESVDEENFQAEGFIYVCALIFTVVSLILSLLSIYSAISMNTEKRRREVAIRKINGARVVDIIRLFCKTYVILWSLACIALFPVIYIAAKRWIETFRQQMSLNASLFLIIYCTVLLLIGLTIIFQILKVARVNPAEVIKK